MEIYQNERTDKYDIPLSHLDHSYVKSCSDEKELEKIIKVLRSGYEGTYPDLEILAEEKLASLKPESKVLRKEKPIRSKHDVGKKEWSELSDDMKSWEEDMKAKDAERQNIPASNSSLPPVRGRQKFVGSTPVETAKSNKKPMPRNHKEWDKVDIDAEIAKVDEEGPKKTVIKDKTEVSPDIYTEGLTAEEKAFKAEQEKNKGNEAFRAGDYEEAQLYYRRSLCIQESAAVYNNRAQTFIKVKKWAEACKDCDSVLRLEPDNIKAYMRRAVSRQGKKDYKPAKSDLQYVLTREPGNKRAQDILKEVEKALMEQKVKGRRMVIEEVDGSSDEEAEEQAKGTLKEAKLTDNGTHNGLQNGDIDDHPAGKAGERIAGNNLENMNSVQVNGVHEETDTEKNITAPETNLPSETETSGKTQTEIPDTKTETQSSSVNKEEGVTDTQSENPSESSPMDTQVEVPAPVVHTPPPPLPPAVVTLKDRGTELYKAGQYSEAISQYQRAVDALERAGPAHRPSLCVMYSNVAACHLKLGDCGACIEDCSRALEINPAGTKALLRRAAAYETKEKLRAAYVDYRQVLLLDSSSTPAQQGSTRCSQALRAQDGVRWREKLPAVAPVAQSLHSLHQQYHEAQRTTPQQQPPSKPAASTKSTGTETTKPAPTVTKPAPTETKPAPTETKPAPTAKTKTSEELGDEYKTEGNNLVKKGRYSEAIPWYTKCIEACSGNVAAYSNRALCYLKTGQPDKVIQDCNVALFREPNHVKALFRRALALKEKSQFTDSVADMKLLLKIDSGNSAARKEFANILRLKQESEQREKEKREREQQLKEKQQKQQKKPQQQHKPQPQKPRQRIKIEEVEGSSDEEPTTKPATSTSKQPAARGGKDSPSKPGSESKSRKKSTKPPSSTPRPTPDLQKASPYEFMQAWTGLKGTEDTQLYSRLLQQVEPKALKTVISNKLDGEMLITIIKCILLLAKQGAASQALDYLRSLPHVPRFSMVSMFMSDDDKKEVTTVINELKASLGDGLSKSDCQAIKKQYGLL